jgi:hypothetical protein
MVVFSSVVVSAQDAAKCTSTVDTIMKRAVSIATTTRYC